MTTHSAHLPTSGGFSISTLLNSTSPVHPLDRFAVTSPLCTTVERRSAASSPEIRERKAAKKPKDSSPVDSGVNSTPKSPKPPLPKLRIPAVAHESTKSESAEATSKSNSPPAALLQPLPLLGFGGLAGLFGLENAATRFMLEPGFPLGNSSIASTTVANLSAADSSATTDSPPLAEIVANRAPFSLAKNPLLHDMNPFVAAAHPGQSLCFLPAQQFLLVCLDSCKQTG